MPNEDILEKLGELKDKMINAPEDNKETIEQWEKLIRRAFLVQNLYEHDAVKIIHEFYLKKVEGINNALQAQSVEDLATQAGLVRRARWEALREAYQSFVTIMSRAEGTIKVINKNVDAEISDK